MLCAHSRQRKGRQAVVHQGGGQPCSDDDATVGGVQRQRVAVPSDLVAWGSRAGGVVETGVTAAACVVAGFSRALRAVLSRLMCPISGFPRVSLTSAACTRSASPLRRTRRRRARRRIPTAVFCTGETTETPQGAINRPPLDQPHRGRQPQYGLGNEGVRPPSPLMRRTPYAPPRGCCEFLIAPPSKGWIIFSRFGVSGPRSFLCSGCCSC